MWPELERALSGGPAIAALGATPGWAAWLATQLADREPLVVVVAPDDAAARALEADIRFFYGAGGAGGAGDIAPLPGIDVPPYAELSPDRSSIIERVATLYRLTQPALRPRLVVTSAEALVRR